MKLLYPIRNITIAVILLLLPRIMQSQGIRVGSGASLVMQGDAKLVLNNAGFVNDGSFTAGNGTVLFTGNLPKSNAFISGSGHTMFNNVAINRPSASILLEDNISIGGLLTMQAGNLELNNRRLDLGYTGSIAGENTLAYITGTDGGVITSTAVLNAPDKVNPGNLGLIISSPANLGTTVITRGHVQQANERGERSINRYFDIRPSANANADMTLKLLYLEPELANNSESSLVLWSKNNAGWNTTGKGYVNSAGRFTLGIADKTVMAKTFLMSSYPNPATDRFTIALYSDTEKRSSISLVDAYGRVLERKPVQYIKGTNTMQWDLAKYASGTYFLVFENTAQPNLKVIKQ